MIPTNDEERHYILEAMVALWQLGFCTDDDCIHVSKQIYEEYNHDGTKL